ncbi:hypothetical protein [Candidatus Lariskella endosymbiont of Hedychridium roseum]|uniref:hypothetical protein n=1 Tax=Candidatus Lariskella endosymbiont of Hedychridium roseum TaxID=3077949 RepID=UPI0030D4E5E3
MSNKLSAGNKNNTTVQKEENNDHHETLNDTVKNVKFEVGSKLYKALRANIRRRKQLRNTDQK